MYEPPDTNIPERIRRERLRELADGHRRHGRVDTKRGFERLGRGRLLGIDPTLVVHGAHQLQVSGELPRKLREYLVLFVEPWKRRVASRLTVVVPEILVSRE